MAGVDLLNEIKSRDECRKLSYEKKGMALTTLFDSLIISENRALIPLSRLIQFLNFVHSLDSCSFSMIHALKSLIIACFLAYPIYMRLGWKVQHLDFRILLFY